MALLSNCICHVVTGTCFEQQPIWWHISSCPARVLEGNCRRKGEIWFVNPRLCFLAFQTSVGQPISSPCLKTKGRWGDGTGCRAAGVRGSGLELTKMNSARRAALQQATAETTTINAEQEDRAPLVTLWPSHKTSLLSSSPCNYAFCSVATTVVPPRKPPRQKVSDRQSHFFPCNPSICSPLLILAIYLSMARNPFISSWKFRRPVT